jgi:hypothetical protein
MGLDDGRMELYRRGPAGGEDHGWPPRGHADPETHERRRPLVYVDMDGDLGSIGERHRHGGGSRPW